MLKHTPGPWSSKALPSGNVSVYSDQGDIGRWMPAPTIADDEAQANANLIAAAPDLLAACRSALSAITESEDDDLGLIADKLADELRQAIQAAAN